MATANRSKDYVYLPIEDAAKVTGVKVNLFAAVSEIGDAKHSKGTDYFLSLKIVDQSSKLGFKVNFFAEDMMKLPHVQKIGDILSLHHVLMKIYNGESCGVFNKRYSSFALYDGEADEGFTPYQTSKNFRPANHDHEFLSQLRTWLLNHHPAKEENTLQLRSIKTLPVFDLVCKVFHVCETPGGDWMLFVWDGTDTPPASFQNNLDTEGENPSPIHLEELPPSREVVCKFPSTGSVLRIIANKSVKEIPSQLICGRWVRVCDVTCELQSGIWKGILQPSSRIRILSDEDEAVLLCLRDYNERVASKVECQPQTRFLYPSQITETDYKDIPYGTLVDSLTRPEVTHMFKCVVRVVAAYPWRAKDLMSPLSGEYRIKFTLEDPTARIHAYVYGEDGVKFFDGYPTYDVLTKKMNKLLGITDGCHQAEGGCATRNPPWVCCNLKSVYLDKADPWGTRIYMVFGTTVVE